MKKTVKILTIIPKSTYDILNNSKTTKFINQTYFYNETNTYQLRNVTTMNIKFADESINKYYLSNESVMKNEDEIELSERDYRSRMSEFENSKYSKCGISKTRYEFLCGLVSVDIFIDFANENKIGIIEIENEKLNNFDLNKNFKFCCDVSLVEEFQDFKMAKTGKFPIDFAVSKFISKMTCPVCGHSGIEKLNDGTFTCTNKCFMTKHTYSMAAFMELLDFYNIFM